MQANLSGLKKLGMAGLLGMGLAGLDQGSGFALVDPFGLGEFNLWRLVFVGLLTFWGKSKWPSSRGLKAGGIPIAFAFHPRLKRRGFMPSFMKI